MESKQMIMKIQSLQKDSSKVRNFCILAHVDHGKTCLSDCLISSNNIISKAMAGKLRYLDSLPAERQREITMKSSSINIIFRQPGLDQDFLINLMDSPGHVDFSFEVSAALRLADNALIVVDALEGVSPQTLTVIRQAWEENVKTCLVINKVDRLFVERFMTPKEAYDQIQRILEEINVQTSSLYRQSIESQQYSVGTRAKARTELSKKEEEEREEEEQKILFSPEKGNVAFTSAIDGWGFTLRDMAELLAKKRGFKPKMLQRHLWGNFYFNPKNNTILSKPTSQSMAQKPMAVSFMLQPLYKQYQKFFPQGVQDKGSELKQARLGIKAVLSKRLPIDRSLLRMIVRHLLSPLEAQPRKLKVLSPRIGNNKLFKQLRSHQRGLKSAIEKVDRDAMTSVYVSKMFRFDPRLLPGQSAPHKFVGFGRVMSGTLHSGDTLFAKGPVVDISQKRSHEPGTKCTINHIYLQMGQQFERVSQVPAGNIVAIGDLDDIILKTGSLFSNPELPAFSPMSFKSKPILRVAVEPVDLADMPKLQAGLKKLNKADPCAQVYIDNYSGEHIIAACGEVHLQRCLEELSEEYAQCQIHHGEPIFTFRETIVLKNIKRKDHKRVKNSGKNDKEIEVVQKTKKRLERKEKEQEEQKQGEEEKKETQENGKLDENNEVSEETEKLQEEEKQKEKEEFIKMARYNQWSGYTDPEDNGLSESSQEKEVKDSQQEQEVLSQYSTEEEPSETSEESTEKQNVKQVGTTDQAQIVASQNLLSDTKNLYIEKWKKVRSNQDVISGFIEDTTQNGVCKFAVRLVALPPGLLRLIETEEETVKQLQEYVEQEKAISRKEPLREKVKKFLQKFEEKIKEAQTSYPRRVSQMLRKHLLGFGPRRCGANALSSTHIDQQNSFLYRAKKVAGLIKPEAAPPKQSTLHRPINLNLAQKYTTTKHLRTSLLSGFQLATLSGPLVQEEMLGVFLMIENIQFLDVGGDFTLEGKVLQEQTLSSPTKIKEEKESEEGEEDKNQQSELNQEVKVALDDKISITSSNSYTKSTSVSKAKLMSNSQTPSVSMKASPAMSAHHGLFSGQIMSTIKHLCRRAFITAQPRLMEAMFLCTLRVQTDRIGQIYSLVSKYRGKVESEECEFESQAFTLKALIPVVQSFKFTDELSNKSSGIAYPQLVFANWETIDQDPFYVPKSQDDIQDFGEAIQPPNLPKRLIHALRKRKGLPLESTLIAVADKQRNLGKMK